ncbi:hypothetical protein TomMM35A_20620 [Sphingobium sp. TomMM35A]
MTGQTPEFRKAIGIGDDGGTGIEDEAVPLPHIGTAARAVPRFDERRVDTRGLKADRQSQAAKARSYDYRFAVHQAEGVNKARMALLMGTGGRPHKMRMRSAQLDCPA